MVKAVSCWSDLGRGGRGGCTLAQRPGLGYQAVLSSVVEVLQYLSV